MNDNLKLSTRKRQFRDEQYKKCIMLPMSDRQEFRGGRKVVLWYPSNKIAKGGYIDAEWSRRIEIHHLVGEECRTYFTERGHDAIIFNRDWQTGAPAPTVSNMRVQRDGATQMVVEDDFYIANYQAFELVGIK